MPSKSTQSTSKKDEAISLHVLSNCYMSIWESLRFWPNLCTQRGGGPHILHYVFLAVLFLLRLLWGVGTAHPQDAGRSCSSDRDCVTTDQTGRTGSCVCKAPLCSLALFICCPIAGTVPHSKLALPILMSFLL